MSKPIVWTIAGSDSSGAAGLQADLKTFHDFKTHGCSIVTAITAQNTSELNQVDYVSAGCVTAQIDILKNDMPAKAVKLGMIGQVEIVNQITDFLKNYSENVVLDPVMISTSGKNLFDSHQYCAQIKKLFPYTTIVTPNIPEAEKLIERQINSFNDIKNAAKDILSMGAKNVLIKGGHFNNEKLSQDFWTNGEESFWLSSQRYENKNYRGTGCTLASAIAAALALGYEMKDAVVIAKMYINQSIRLASKNITNSALIINAGWPEEEIDLPYLTFDVETDFSRKFVDCGPKALGLYPVVDSAKWVKKLVEQGVTTIQLRCKDKTGNELENEIRESVAIANQHQARLFINDYWEYAIKFAAYGVHLGQDDLDLADINKIHHAGLRLGISTHCYYEVARAHSYKPSYLACGPIFPTTSKQMPFAPQGLDKLKRWRRTLNYPLVAIGGITLDNMPEILESKIEGIALISAITHSKNPDHVTQQMLAKVREYQ